MGNGERDEHGRAGRREEEVLPPPPPPSYKRPPRRTRTAARAAAMSAALELWAVAAMSSMARAAPGWAAPN